MTRDAARRLRVLVVDDEWLIAAATEDMLGQLGHETVGPAGSVTDALALIADAVPDAALLDVSLRQTRSYPIADRLAELGVPFAFVTGYADADLPAKYRARAVLTKPMSISDLKSALVALFTRDRERS